MKWVSLITLSLAWCTSGIAIETIYYPQDRELEEYLDAMPWDYYEQYQVEHLGKFWIAPAKDCVKDTLKNGYLWEPYLLILFHKYVQPGDIVIDLGAHVGSHSIALSNLVGPDGIVFAFEGTNQLFRELVHNIELNGKNNILPLHYWITDQSGRLTLGDEGTYCYNRNYSPVSDGKAFTVEMRTLDSFHFDNVSLIKIDVETTEDAVLDGALETIMRCRPILIIEIMGGHDSSQPEVRERIEKTKEKLDHLDYQVELLWVDDYLAIPKEKVPCPSN